MKHTYTGSHRDHHPWRHARRLVGGICACSQSGGCLRVARLEIHPRGPRRLAGDRLRLLQQIVWNKGRAVLTRTPYWFRMNLAGS